MRKFLSSKAGATFLSHSSYYTFCVRKDTIEIIFKVKAGLNIIINLVQIGETKGLLIANWGAYFDRMTNPKRQMPQIERCCPTLYKLMARKDEDGIKEMQIGHTEEMPIHGFGLEIDLPNNRPLIFSLTPEVVASASILTTKMVKIYNELSTKPPFPAWSDALNEVWE